MKKVLLFAVVLGAVTLTSCKKDYECNCTGTYSAYSVKWEGLSSDEADAAEQACGVLNTGAAFSSESCSFE